MRPSRAGSIAILGLASALVVVAVAAASFAVVFRASLSFVYRTVFHAHDVLVHAGLADSPRSYALVGMAAAIAATTHAPLMAAVLAFELSGDNAIVLPLVLATAAATLVPGVSSRTRCPRESYRGAASTGTMLALLRSETPGLPTQNRPNSALCGPLTHWPVAPRY